MHKLKYISESILAELKADVPSNLQRYKSAGFDDKSDVNGWSMALNSVEIDRDKLALLDPAGGSDIEVGNSMLVFEAFSGMTRPTPTTEALSLLSSWATAAWPT